MISIGSVLHGPELQDSLAHRLIAAVMRAAIRCRGTAEFAIGPAINVVFYVPGSLGSPDWEGTRDAKFSRKRKLLMVQVAVPEALVDSPALKEYLVESLHSANHVAVEFFRQKGIDYPLADAESLVETIKERLDSEFGSPSLAPKLSPVCQAVVPRTKKLLAPFDPTKPERNSRQFLVPGLRKETYTFRGLDDAKEYQFGRVVYCGEPVSENELFATLVDSGTVFEDVGIALERLRNYVQQIGGFRIGEVVRITPGDEAGTFLLERVTHHS
jgi:hypothetical protein